MQLVFEERASKGIVKDYYSKADYLGKDFREPPYFYKVLMDMVEADPILWTAVHLTADLATYRGFTLNGENDRLIKEATKKFNDELDFDQVSENLIWQLLVYGDAYLELRWNQSHTQIKELHPLETTDMIIAYDEHGEIVGYKQKIEGKSPSEYILFAKDEVIYFRMHWVGSQVYSKNPFKSLSKSFATKVYANDFLQGIFRNLPPKTVYFLKNANKEERKVFIENLFQAKVNPNIDIVALGEAFESKLQQPTFDDGMIKVLDFLRKEILMVTRVPPHWVGIMDGVNRGIGENIVIPYETKIKKIQQKIASQLNRELLPKLGYSNLEFKWNSISLMDEKSIVEIMNFLKAQGFDSETIIHYGREHGLNFRQGAEILETPPVSNNNQTLLNKTAKSRQGDNQKTNKMGSGIDKKGVSAEGKEKLDQKKVM